MRKYLTTLIILSIFFSSCHFGTSGTWINGNIAPEVKKEIEPLNRALYESIQKKDTTSLKQLISPELMARSGKLIDSITNIVGPTLSGSSYEVIDEYYTKNTATKVPNTLISSIAQNDGYIINYIALNEEMYVSVLKSTKLTNNVLLITVYGKYGNDWKINIIQIGQYQLAGKTAPDYYRSALNLYHSGDMVDAADMIITASQIATPGGPYFKYKNEAEMKDLYSKVVKEANTIYKFPITVTQITTKPLIFGVNPQFIGDKGREGVYPVINYKSNIVLSDTAALRAENNSLQKNIASIFTGIEKNNNHILYQAFNELPGKNKQIHRYGFVQKIK